MPQATPSLRLLTMPAWLAADRARSRKLVRAKTSLVDSPAWASAEAATWVRASWRACPWVSRTNRVERPRPSPAKAMPRKNGSGRNPAPALGADQVDLHDHRGGPGQPLVDAEQDVGEDDPAPPGPEGEEERDRDADEPAGDQDRSEE